jgi:hypothetical protein
MKSLNKLTFSLGLEVHFGTWVNASRPDKAAKMAGQFWNSQWGKLIGTVKEIIQRWRDVGQNAIIKKLERTNLGGMRPNES